MFPDPVIFWGRQKQGWLRDRVIASNSHVTQTPLTSLAPYSVRQQSMLSRVLTLEICRYRRCMTIGYH